MPVNNCFTALWGSVGLPKRAGAPSVEVEVGTRALPLVSVRVVAEAELGAPFAEERTEGVPTADQKGCNVGMHLVDQLGVMKDPEASGRPRPRGASPPAGPNATAAPQIDLRSSPGQTHTRAPAIPARDTAPWERGRTRRPTSDRRVDEAAGVLRQAEPDCRRSSQGLADRPVTGSCRKERIVGQDRPDADDDGVYVGPHWWACRRDSGT